MQGWVRGKWVDLRDWFTPRFIIARIRRRRGSNGTQEQVEEDTKQRETSPGLQPLPTHSPSPAPSASQFPLPPESTSDTPVRKLGAQNSLVQAINTYIQERNASHSLTTDPIPPISPRHASLRFSHTPLFELPKSEYDGSSSRQSVISEGDDVHSGFGSDSSSMTQSAKRATQNYRSETIASDYSDATTSQSPAHSFSEGNEPEKTENKDLKDNENLNPEGREDRDVENSEEDYINDSVTRVLDDGDKQQKVWQNRDREDSFRKDIGV